MIPALGPADCRDRSARFLFFLRPLVSAKPAFVAGSSFQRSLYIPGIYENFIITYSFISYRFDRRWFGSSLGTQSSSWRNGALGSSSTRTSATISLPSRRSVQTPKSQDTRTIIVIMFLLMDRLTDCVRLLNLIRSFDGSNLRGAANG